MGFHVMHLETTISIRPRVGLLAIVLFSTAVHLVNASDDLGTASGPTLVDTIHVMILAYILVAAIITVASREPVERGWEASDVARLTYRAGVGISGVGISFVAINALLIAVAVRGG